jgi:hypothetical protein
LAIFENHLRKRVSFNLALENFIIGFEECYGK